MSVIKSPTKFGDSIYFEEPGTEPGLYIIQYISSTLDWKSGQIFLDQKVMPVVSWDPRLRVTTTISSKKEETSSTLNFRIPFWTTSDAKATLNSRDIPLTSAGNFLSVTKKWSSSEVITLDLPIALRMEQIQDDRTDYNSLQAILFGPYLLVGLSTGDFNLKPSPGALSDWITPIPSDYNSHLVSLSQEHEESTFVLALSNNSITMLKYPDPGTSDSVCATFRIILSNTITRLSSYKDAMGKTVMLEPYNLPGKVIIQLGNKKSLGIGSSADSKNALFRLVEGTGEGTVRLESENQKGCFVFALNGMVKLSCGSGGSGGEDSGFIASTSFKMNAGVSDYHSISFVANGLNRDFLLQPLFSLRDEHYTVYFKVNS